MQCASIEAYATPERYGSADLVVMCHVLEHIESFPDALVSVRRLLRPGGYLYVAVPNVRAWQARLPGWTGFQPYHVHHFSQEAVRRALERAGFGVVWAKTYEPLSGWFNALCRTLLIGRGAAHGSGVGRRDGTAGTMQLRVVYEVLRLAIGVALSPVRWAQAWAGYGEELVIVATPQRKRAGTPVEWRAELGDFGQRASSLRSVIYRETVDSGLGPVGGVGEDKKARGLED